MSEYSIVGLPGLYQNWLLAVLDPESVFKLDLENNFLCFSSRYKWIQKINVDFFTAQFSGTTVNTYVSDQNFVWFLYNFLEKTDGVGIHIDTLVTNLETKAAGTVAFDSMLKHFLESYNITLHSDLQYKNNAAIEYFYFLLLDKTSRLKTQSKFTDPKFVNIEYADFEDQDVLRKKLSHLEMFDTNHFNRMYDLLYKRNTRYLTSRRNFVNKIQSGNKEFDILETAYIGMLLTDHKPLDWFNPELRKHEINKRWFDICNLANNLL